MAFVVKEYIKHNKDRFLSELFEFLRIPSISADSRYKEDVRIAANYVKKKLKEAGADTVRLYETKGYPVVYGEKIIDNAFPTVLVYGHYDVQPPDPLSLWHSPPFEPTIRNGKIFARGACDDKGQVYMHVKALESMIALNCLSCNIKFIIEGEEEVGSGHLGEFVVQNKELLKADIIMVSDTALISLHQPSITVGLRGLSYVEVEVTGPNRDLHSGMYGGAVANPIHVLCEMLHALIDENGRITIPGFYDNVREYSTEERAFFNNIPFDANAYKSELDIEATKGEKGYNTLERLGIRPSLDVNGIWGGYTGEGAKTVLPSKAHAKISIRLVPDQSSREITSLFTRYLKSLAPTQVKVGIKVYHGGEPVILSTDSTGYKAASKAFEDVWGKTPLPNYDGASIPIVSLFKKELGLDAILMGFGLPSDAIHSPNEGYRIENFTLGIETIIAFYKHFALCPK